MGREEKEELDVNGRTVLKEMFKKLVYNKLD
jgi:hypothetical protein